MTSSSIVKMIADKTDYTQKDIKAFLVAAEPVLLEALKLVSPLRLWMSLFL